MHLSLVIDFEGGGSCKNRLFVAPKYYYAEVISLPNREEKLRKKVQGRRKEGLGHGVDCSCGSRSCLQLTFYVKSI